MEPTRSHQGTPDAQFHITSEHTSQILLKAIKLLQSDHDFRLGE